MDIIGWPAGLLMAIVYAGELFIGVMKSVVFAKIGIFAAGRKTTGKIAPVVFAVRFIVVTRRRFSARRPTPGSG